MARTTDCRPVFLNLLQIRMPVGALTSITHRVTGVLLALGVPFAIYLLQASVESPQSYARVNDMFDPWFVKFAAVILIWSLAHHLLAGIRHLLSDIDVGSRLSAARRSAWIVNVSGLAVAGLAAAAFL
jgi:succinate dehydrogenase / fumarate reductase cytochrome b subunit